MPPNDSSAAGNLDAYRDYLLLVAARRIRPELRGKISASDLVQETLWEATRDEMAFTGQTSQEYRRWLRRILRNNIRDAERRFLADKRDAGRELRLDQSSKLWQLATSDSVSSEAMQRELAAQLEKAIDQLPRSYRDVILLRNRGNLPFREIAIQLGLSSADAARKQWGRAIGELRQLLMRPDST